MRRRHKLTTGNLKQTWKGRLLGSGWLCLERVNRIYWLLGVESVREKVKGNHREGGMPYVKGNLWRGKCSVV